MSPTIGVIFDKVNMIGLYPIYKSTEHLTMVYQDSSKNNLLYIVSEADDKYTLMTNNCTVLGDNMIDSQVIEFIRNDIALNGIKPDTDSVRHLTQIQIPDKRTLSERFAKAEVKTPRTVTKKREISLDLDDEE